MAIEPIHGTEAPGVDEQPLDRRALFKSLGVAAAAGAGLAVAGVPLDASPAGATTGTMQFGTDNFAGSDTTHLTSSNDSVTLAVYNAGAGDALFADAEGGGNGLNANAYDNGIAVYGTSGAGDAVLGVGGQGGGSAAGNGVHGISDEGAGISGIVAGVLGETDVSGRDAVAGLSADGNGLHGVSVAASTTFTGFVAGVVGESNDTSAPREGVVGLSETGDGTAGYSNAADRSGVYGENRSTGVGVGAFTTNGTGVSAVSTNGTGVVGQSSSSIGVLGHSLGAGSGIKAISASGHAVEATSGGTTATVIATNSMSGGGGLALQVTGKASFSRSGKISVPSGASSVTKTGIPLTSSSFVLATIQKHLGGFQIEAAVPNVAGSKLTIFFNKPAPAATTVAWFVVN